MKSESYVKGSHDNQIAQSDFDKKLIALLRIDN